VVAVFEAVLVAGSGLTAARAIRSLSRMRVKSVAVHITADGGALHARAADDSLLLGSDPSAYRDVAALVEAAHVGGVDAVYPCDDLAEDQAAAAGVAGAGLAWVGASAAALAAAGRIAGPPTGVVVAIAVLADRRIVTLGAIRRDAEETRLVMDLPPGQDRAARAAVEHIDLTGACWVVVEGGSSGAGTDDVPFVHAIGARLPADHAVLELATGIDIVETQLRIAAGERAAFDADEPPARRAAAGLPIRADGTIAVWPRWEKEPGNDDAVRIDAALRVGRPVTAPAGTVIGYAAAAADSADAAVERAREAVAQLRRRSTS